MTSKSQAERVEALERWADTVAADDLFADQLDADPWLLLQWRGRSRDEIIDLLRTDQPSAETVGPWWPFGPGPLPDEALTAPLQPSGRSLPVNGDASAVLDLLQPTELEIRTTPVVDIIRGAYRAVNATDDSQQPQSAI